MSTATSEVSSAPCKLCDMAHPAAPVTDLDGDQHWTLFINHDRIPGSIWIRSNAHVEGLWNLSDEESGSFGTMVRRAAQLLRREYGAEKTYLLSLGERLAHVHALVIARIEGAHGGAQGLDLLMTHLESRPEHAVTALDAIGGGT